MKTKSDNWIVIILLLVSLSGCGKASNDPLMVTYENYRESDQIGEADVDKVALRLEEVRQRRLYQYKSLMVVRSKRANSSFGQNTRFETEKREYPYRITQYVPLFHLSHALARTTNDDEHIRQAFWDGVDLFTFYTDFEDNERDKDLSEWAKIRDLVAEHGGEQKLEEQLRALILDHADILADDLVSYIVNGATLYNLPPDAEPEDCSEIADTRRGSDQAAENALCMLLRADRYKYGSSDEWQLLSKVNIDPQNAAFSNDVVGNASGKRRILFLAKLNEWLSELDSPSYRRGLIAAYIESFDAQKSAAKLLTKADTLLFLIPHKSQVAPDVAQLHTDVAQRMEASHKRGESGGYRSIYSNPSYPTLQDQYEYPVFVATMELLNELVPGSKADLACNENLIEISPVAARYYLESLDKGAPCLLAQIEASILSNRSGEISNLDDVLAVFDPGLEQLHEWSEAQFNSGENGRTIDAVLAEQTKAHGSRAFEFYRERLCTPVLGFERLTDYSVSNAVMNGEITFEEFDRLRDLGFAKRALAYDRVRLFRNDDVGTTEALLTALDRCGDPSLANRLLKAGPELSEAARKWARENGYSVLAFDLTGTARTAFGEVKAPEYKSRFADPD